MDQFNKFHDIFWGEDKTNAQKDHGNADFLLNYLSSTFLFLIYFVSFLVVVLTLIKLHTSCFNQMILSSSVLYVFTKKQLI